MTYPRSRYWGHLYGYHTANGDGTYSPIIIYAYDLILIVTDKEITKVEREANRQLTRIEINLTQMGLEDKSGGIVTSRRDTRAASADPKKRGKNKNKGINVLYTWA